MANPDAPSIEDDARVSAGTAAEASAGTAPTPCGAGPQAGDAAASSVMAASTATIPTTDSRVDTTRASGLLMMMRLPRVTLGGLSGAQALRVLKQA